MRRNRTKLGTGNQLGPHSLRFVLAAMIGVLALLLSGCTGGSDDGDDVSGSGFSGRLVFWDSSDLIAQSPVVRQTIEGFEQANPDLDVVYRNVDPGRIVELYSAAVEERDPPDIVRLPAPAVPVFAAAGHLAGLDDLTEAEDWSDQAEVAAVSGRWGGSQYGIPQAAEAPALFLPEGRTGETETWQTWEQVSASGAKVGGIRDGFTLLPAIYATGGRMLDTNAELVEITTEESIAGFELATSLAEDDVFLPAGKASRPLVDAIGTGAAGAWVVQPDELATYGRDQPADRAEPGRLLPMPAGPDGRRGTPWDGQYLTLNAQTSAAAAGKELIAALTSTQTQRDLAEAGLMPTRLSAYPDEADGVRSWLSDYRAVLDSAVAAPTVAAASALYPPIWREWQNMVDGRSTARVGSQLIAAAWLPILPRSYELAP